ncbi:MAG: PAS domain-containing protein, partial [Dehalococcoidia bacterium]
MPELLELFSSTEDGVYAVNSDQEIILWNKGAKKILGYRREEVIGRNCYDLLAGKDEAGNVICTQDCQVMQKLELGPAWNDTGFVFTRLDGRPLDPSKVSADFRRTADATKLHNMRFHDLRHTHASIMLKAGVHPKVVSER